MERAADEGGRLMSATAPAGQPAVSLREPNGWRRAKDRIVLYAMWLAFLALVVPLVFVLVTVIAKGAHVITWQFLTSGPIPPNTLPADVSRVPDRAAIACDGRSRRASFDLPHDGQLQ